METGFKDRCGQDIYCGDNCIYYDGSKYIPCVVVLNTKTMCYEYKSLEEGEEKRYDMNVSKHVKIRGDI